MSSVTDILRFPYSQDNLSHSRHLTVPSPTFPYQRFSPTYITSEWHKPIITMYTVQTTGLLHKVKSLEVSTVSGLYLSLHVCTYLDKGNRVRN